MHQDVFNFLLAFLPLAFVFGGVLVGAVLSPGRSS